MTDYAKVLSNGEIATYDEEGINYDDIPEITDFTKWRKNPFVGKFIKNGKFIAEIEHGGYNEIAEFDTNTGQKTVLQLVIKDSQIVVENLKSNHLQLAST